MPPKTPKGPKRSAHLQQAKGDDAVVVPIHRLEETFGGKEWDFGTGKEIGAFGVHLVQTAVLFFGGKPQNATFCWGGFGSFLLKLAIFGNSCKNLMGFF